MFGIIDGLQFASVAIAGTLIYIKRLIGNEVPHLVHVPDRPVRQLAIVNHLPATGRPQTEGEGATRELLALEALQLALANRTHRQAVPHDRLVEPCARNGFEETFWGGRWEIK